MRIFAIDPGTTQSGWVLYDFDDDLMDVFFGKTVEFPRGGQVVQSGVDENHDLLRWVQHGQRADLLAIEMIASYGMPVGCEVFDTVRWIGRFQQAWSDPEAVRLVFRQQVKLELCKNLRANDANVKQALLDRVGPAGTKKKPGPTYGVKSHAWAALGVAVTAAVTRLSA